FWRSVTRPVAHAAHHAGCLLPLRLGVKSTAVQASRGVGQGPGAAAWRAPCPPRRAADSVDGIGAVAAATASSDGGLRRAPCPLAPNTSAARAANRLEPQIGDARVAAAAGAFRPSLTSNVGRNNQLQPPASFLIPSATRADVVTSSIGLNQRLPWFGTSYS